MQKLLQQKIQAKPYLVCRAYSIFNWKDSLLEVVAEPAVGPVRGAGLGRVQQAREGNLQKNITVYILVDGELQLNATSKFMFSCL